MYSDQIDSAKLTQKPMFILAMLLVTGTCAYFIDPFSKSLLQSGFLGDSVVLNKLAGAVSVAAALVLNIVIVSAFPRKIQIGLVWLELTTLFLGVFALFDLSLPFIASKLGFLITQGMVTTLYVSAISISIATVIAMIGAIAKLSQSGFAYGIASFYTSLFRGLPLLMQIYLIYVGLPQLGYVVDAVPAGVAALSLCYGAYMTEIFRAGIQSIPRGQWEAARALGFRPHAIMRRIILPQSVPIIIPPIGNQFIAMLKDSSLVSVIGVWEIMYLARTMGNQTFQHMEMLVTAGLIYWVLTIVLEIAQARLERYFQKGRR
jgi:polar amino acid transport system permease protein